MDRVLLIIVFMPIAVGFALLFLPNRLRTLPKALTLLISAATFALGVLIFTRGSFEYAWPVLHIDAVRLDLLFRAGPLASFMLLFAMGFGLLIAIYSLKSMNGVTRANEYYGAVMLTIGGSAGILLSNHLLFLLIFWEVVTASLYLMITTGGRNSNFAATKSFAMIGVSDAAFLLGIAMLWMYSGTFVISNIAVTATTTIPVIAFLLLMTAAITKAGSMPLHTWIPTSGEYAPASVMALLPAAIDKLLGIYLLILIVRGLFILKPGALTILLAAIGSITIIVAVMIAMVQHNLKKLLSYHAISQVGYMILGIATMTPIGIAGGVFHMLNNAIYKCCLFLCGGAVEQQAGTVDLERLGGLAKKMSLTFTACLVAALSISGIPPLNGFVSKWMIYQGVIDMGNAQTGAVAALWPVWLVVAMFGSALTLASFVKVIHSVFLSRLPSRLKDVREVSLVQTGPMLFLALLCVFFGVFYYVPLRLFIYPALGIPSDALILGTWNSTLATGLILIGIAIGFVILVIGRLTKQVRIVPTWSCGEAQDNDQMIIPGTHFYKTISSMRGLRRLYAWQDKGVFDPYDKTGKAGQAVSDLLRWLHSGLLPMYLTWVTLGVVAILFVVCKIW